MPVTLRAPEVRPSSCWNASLERASVDEPPGGLAAHVGNEGSGRESASVRRGVQRAQYAFLRTV